ncbi:MAG: thioesterase family protein [Stenotrophomonas sp.]|nr:thioesterase family protein [Stenotrophomonas lacuserhaii]MDX3931096.1 thioesterase family protein [Stenotrophomonas sp.]
MPDLVHRPVPGQDAALGQRAPGQTGGGGQQARCAPAAQGEAGAEEEGRRGQEHRRPQQVHRDQDHRYAQEEGRLMSTEHKILARIPISVRWRDMDSMGHVNNAKYISYLEEARVRWMLGVEGVAMTDRIAPVVAATNVNYRLPIVWPNDILVELFVERLGNSSVTIGHRIVDQQDESRLYSDGNVVVVWMDTQTGRSAPLPDAVRNAST